MIKETEIKALVNLLDDPDPEIFKSVNEKLASAGDIAIPHLEARYGIDNNKLINERIESLIEDIRNQTFISDFEDWYNSGKNTNILDGIYYVNSLFYPDTNYEDFKNKIAGIRNKIWLEMKDNLTGFEAIKILNRYIYVIFGYNVEKKASEDKALLFPEYIFINKKVSPFPFVAIYCLIAESLNLPVFPVYLPGLLLISYVNEDIANEAYGEKASGILFYINPYDSGSFLGRKALSYVAKKREIEAKDEDYQPLDYRAFIKKYLNYLENFKIFSNDKAASGRFEKMLEIVNNK